MRLGDHACIISPNSKTYDIYRESEVFERHRHRFEVNNAYIPALEACGLLVSGRCPTADLVEIIELPAHPFFIATQFHPEFSSRPNLPHPIFKSFIAAALQHKRSS